MMIYGWDAVTIISFVLCLLILALGCLGYAKRKDRSQFSIGVAFGLFAVSHLFTLLGIEREFELTMILIRIFGYLIVVFTLYNIEFKRRNI